MRRWIPPRLFILLILLMLSMPFIPTISEMKAFPGAIPFGLSLVCISLGLLFLFGAWAQFQRSKSEINPFNTPRNLVTDGFFRVTRNPMYLGFLLLLLAIALIINLWPAFAAPVIFFLVANSWYIPMEEKAASEAFGDPYIAYRAEVRRWI